MVRLRRGRVGAVRLFVQGADRVGGQSLRTVDSAGSGCRPAGGVTGQRPSRTAARCRSVSGDGPLRGTGSGGGGVHRVPSCSMCRSNHAHPPGRWCAKSSSLAAWPSPAEDCCRRFLCATAARDRPGDPRQVVAHIGQKPYALQILIGAVVLRPAPDVLGQITNLHERPGRQQRGYVPIEPSVPAPHTASHRRASTETTSEFQGRVDPRLRPVKSPIEQHHRASTARR